MDSKVLIKNGCNQYNSDIYNVDIISKDDNKYISWCNHLASYRRNRKLNKRKKIYLESVKSDNEKGNEGNEGNDEDVGDNRSDKNFNDIDNIGKDKLPEISNLSSIDRRYGLILKSFEKNCRSYLSCVFPDYKKRILKFNILNSKRRNNYRELDFVVGESYPKLIIEIKTKLGDQWTSGAEDQISTSVSIARKKWINIRGCILRINLSNIIKIENINEFDFSYTSEVVNKLKEDINNFLNSSDIGIKIFLIDGLDILKYCLKNGFLNKDIIEELKEIKKSFNSRQKNDFSESSDFKVVNTTVNKTDMLENKVNENIIKDSTCKSSTEQYINGIYCRRYGIRVRRVRRVK